MRILTVVLAFLIMGLTASGATAQVVKVGALQDTTGATSDVGKNEAAGVREAFQYYTIQVGLMAKRSGIFNTIMAIVFLRPLPLINDSVISTKL